MHFVDNNKPENKPENKAETKQSNGITIWKLIIKILDSERIIISDILIVLPASTITFRAVTLLPCESHSFGVVSHRL